MKRVLLFAGTSEGRRLAELLEQEEIPAYVCVATEYGETLLPECAGIQTESRRLNQAEMEALMVREAFSHVVDATHPYAAVVSENIQAACTVCGLPYLRLLREESAEDAEDCILAESVEDAVRYLQDTDGNVLITTGSKELAKYTAIPNYRERLFARVLSTEEAVAECRKLGFEGRNLIAMQGPFSEEFNCALLKQIQAKYMVTKESGKAGGFPEKLRAARAASVKVILVQRPRQETGYSFAEVAELLGISKRTCQVAADSKAGSGKPTLAIVGIGMGGSLSLTGEAEKACREADVILGAGRILETLARFEKPMEAIYRAEAIGAYAKEHPEYRNLVVGMSGDVGFYSGAKKLLEQLDGFEIRLIPGISSPVYFCAKLGIPWEDVKLISLHGRAANLPASVRKHRRVFALAGGRECSAGDICQSLMDDGFSHVRVTVGQELSYPEERILSGTPKELVKKEWTGLQVLLIENPEADMAVVTHGLPDDAFLRGNAPMTKEEIREISLSKLRLTAGAVAYDVGAGTGSVAVEMALQATDGMIYAIEKKEDALELLKENRKRLGVPNLTVVSGTAPEALRELPAPTHAFIGGSSGNLADILNLLLEKNPRARVVVNAVTLETAAEMTIWLKQHSVDDLDVAQVAVAKARTLGSYHLMTGANPVTIFSFTGKGEIN
ncbi:precorrin-6A reductase [Hominifimenecus sp. rT4P-3]|uniref:precorrin-6A reductase n=1 Tax=Hominifimenecus sp. rT4P-3 TaxID=3242979 RepID=UPI003DA60777